MKLIQWEACSERSFVESRTTSTCASPRSWRSQSAAMTLNGSARWFGSVEGDLRLGGQDAICLANTQIQTVIGPFLAAMALGDEFHREQNQASDRSSLRSASTSTYAWAP